MKYGITPLFSKVFYERILDIDTKKIVSLINDNEFQKSGHGSKIDVDNICSASISKHILEKDIFSELKNIVMQEFNFFKNNIMFFENDFKITTSWLTRSTNEQSSNYHNHNNCMYSGILYLQTDKNSGDISFENFNNNRYKVNTNDYNQFNSQEWQFKPVNGLILIFPSEVHHKILKNSSDITRYSLAFNFVPVGKIGDGDSFIDMDINHE
mgnify:FL=1